MDRLQKEKEFISNNPILSLNDDKRHDLIIPYINNFFNKYDKFTIVYIQEVLRSTKTLNHIYEKVQETGKEILISCATTAHGYLFAHPITNLFMWQWLTSKSELSWNSPCVIQLGKKYFYDCEKEIKGILSVRKETKIRNRLFEKIKHFDGICRYAKYAVCFVEETPELYERTKHFPNWEELMKEYNKSYVSFIIESEPESELKLNQLSEKTLVGFLSKTIVIPYGGKHYLKELQDMGFYTWNHEFGFGDGDEYSRESEEKDEKYINCINYFNNKSIEDISKLYKDNLDKIESNYNLAKVVFEDREWWDSNIVDNFEFK